MVGVRESANRSVTVMPQMRVLLTNDDGIHAPGLGALEKRMDSAWALTTVAPAEEQSGMSHALTMNSPLRVSGHGDGRWAVTGTPVDCVYLALHKLCTSVPSLVVSGINKGANLGDDVFYSGTVGAAREAALNGIPALAVSLNIPEGDTRLYFETAAAVAVAVIQQIVEEPLPEGCFLNLNVPNLPAREVKGVVACPLGQRHYEPLVEERLDPRGKTYFWIGGHPVGEKMMAGSDGNWIAEGYATLTPLGLDNTARDHLPRADRWLPSTMIGDNDEQS